MIYINERKGTKEDRKKGSKESKNTGGRNDLRKERSKECKKGKKEHLSQFRVVNEVRSVSVDEGAQGQAILPTET